MFSYSTCIFNYLEYFLIPLRMGYKIQDSRFKIQEGLLTNVQATHFLNYNYVAYFGKGKIIDNSHI